MSEPTLYRKIAGFVELKNPPEGALLCWVVPVEPDDLMNAAHKLVHPMYDNAADCDKFWCEPFRALKKGVGGDDE
jgi:hypothetical protein